LPISKGGGFRARDELVEAVKEAAAAEDTTPSEWWRRLALDRLKGQGPQTPLPA
jgi:hypothetical protein